MNHIAVPPHLTSFGINENRPACAADNLITNIDLGCVWGAETFLDEHLYVTADSTAPNGRECLFFDTSDTSVPEWHILRVSVRPHTEYVFSAWVKGAHLSSGNRGRATFGVVDSDGEGFLLYAPLAGKRSCKGRERASALSTPLLQLQPTAWDNRWHLRSVSFSTEGRTTVGIAVYGAVSQMWLADLALFERVNACRYVDPTVNGAVRAEIRTDAEPIHNHSFEGKTAREFWLPGCGRHDEFISVTNDTLIYAASHRPVGLYYIKWVDVCPDTVYTFCTELQILQAGGGKLVLFAYDAIGIRTLAEFPFDKPDNTIASLEVSIHTGTYSRIGIGICDGGGKAHLRRTKLLCRT